MSGEKEMVMSRLLTAICAVSLVAPLGSLADEPKDKKNDEIPAFRELSAKGVKTREDGKATEPIVVKSAKELSKVMADKAEEARVNKEVDWDKQYLLVFAWGGSGGDKLTTALSVKDG